MGTKTMTDKGLWTHLIEILGTHPGPGKVAVRRMASAEIRTLLVARDATYSSLSKEQLEGLLLGADVDPSFPWRVTTKGDQLIFEPR
jgi:hypothetical protein